MFFMILFSKLVSLLLLFIIKGGDMVAKKEYAEGSFGAYLVKLLEGRNKSQVEFIADLGISKTYFVDVLNGRLKPPAPDMQDRMIDVLHLEGRERYELYDRAAEGRKELPKDVVDYLLNNSVQIKSIREEMRRKL